MKKSVNIKMHKTVFEIVIPSLLLITNIYRCIITQQISLYFLNF